MIFVFMTMGSKAKVWICENVVLGASNNAQIKAIEISMIVGGLLDRI